MDVASADIDMVDALITAQDAGDRPAVVVVGGLEDEQVVAILVQKGAEDYLIKQF